MESMDDVVEGMKKQWQQRERHFMDVVHTLRESLVEERQRSSARAGSEEQRDEALERQAVLARTVQQLRSDLEDKKQTIEELQRRLDVAEAEAVGVSIDLEAARWRPGTAEGWTETDEVIVDEASCQTIVPRRIDVATEATSPPVTIRFADMEVQTEAVDQFEAPRRDEVENNDASEDSSDDLVDLDATNRDIALVLGNGGDQHNTEGKDAVEEEAAVPALEKRDEESNARCEALEQALEKAVSMSEALSNWSEHLLKVSEERRVAVEALERKLTRANRERDELDMFLAVTNHADALSLKKKNKPKNNLSCLQKTQVVSIYMQCSYEELCDNLNSRFGAEKSMTWDDKRLLYAIVHELLPITMSTICSHIVGSGEGGSGGVRDSELPLFLKMWNDDVVYPIVSFHRGSSSEALRNISTGLRAIIAKPPTLESLCSRTGKGASIVASRSQSTKKTPTSAGNALSVRFEEVHQEEHEGEIEDDDDEDSEASHSTLEGELSGFCSSSATSQTIAALGEDMELSTTSRAAIQNRRRSVQQSLSLNAMAPPPLTQKNTEASEGPLLGLYTKVDESEWFRDEDDDEP